MKDMGNLKKVTCDRLYLFLIEFCVQTQMINGLNIQVENMAVLNIFFISFRATDDETILKTLHFPKTIKIYIVLSNFQVDCQVLDVKIKITSLEKTNASLPMQT